MSAIVKTNKSYNCLVDFRNNCDSNKHKKLIDIFFPMLYQENKHYLKISVGKKIPDRNFQSILSTITTDFIVGVSCWNNEPQFVFRNNTKLKNVITVVNLALIKDIQIKAEEDNKINLFVYNIYFNYNDEIDYHIHIIIEK